MEVIIERLGTANSNTYTRLGFKGQIIICQIFDTSQIIKLKL